MKNILAALVFLCASVAWAAEPTQFQFEFFNKDNDQYIIANIKEMTYIGEAASWALVANWQPYRDSSRYKTMHSITVYRSEQVTDINAIKFDKIFTYGSIDCETNHLHIINEFYADSENKVVLQNKFTYYEYVVNLNANIILQTLLIYSCRSESV